MQRERVSVNVQTFGKLIRCAAEARRPEQAVWFAEQLREQGPAHGIASKWFSFYDFYYDLGLPKGFYVYV